MRLHSVGQLPYAQAGVLMMGQEEYEWRQQLSAGDEVVVVKRTVEREPLLTTADRVTKTQIITTAGRFRKETGRVVGAGSPYLSMRTCRPTDELRRQFQRDKLIRRAETLSFGLRNRCHELPPQHLTKVVDVLADAVLALDDESP